MVPPGCGYIAGKEAGSIVGIMIGIGVGLVAGGLASYALEKWYSYSDEFDRWIESLPRVVKWLIAEGEIVWLFFHPVAGALMAGFATAFIVHQMAG
jgi:ABC-type antimicrobial peptide transport system permease subunit